MTPQELKKESEGYFADNAHAAEQVFYATADGNFFNKASHHAALHHAHKTKSKVYTFYRDKEEVAEADPQEEKERVKKEADAARDKDVADSIVIQNLFDETRLDPTKETVAAFKKTLDKIKPSAEVKAFGLNQLGILQSLLVNKKKG